LNTVICLRYAFCCRSASKFNFKMSIFVSVISQLVS
jgi:hypothetical protein